MEPPPVPPPDGTPSGHSAAMDAPESSKKRVRQPRNSACSACAGLKMKCVRNEEGSACERCTRMKVECLPVAPKPRKRREGEFVSSHGSATLPAPDADSTPVKQPSTLPSPVPKPSAISNATHVPKDSPSPRGNLHNTGSKSFTALLAQGLALETLQAPSSELLRGIDANALVNACTVFRQYSAYFPFVSIPLRIDGVSMASQRPMTALAVYTVTAAADRDQQERLSHAFRLALAAKVLINGERHVDLLAGLLIHLAWNHHYMTRQQIHQNLCLLSGMTADLGLYKTPPRGDVTDPTVAAELDRCFVGAYFLCSLVPPFAFSKHNPMRWTDNLRICADNIIRAGELQSDRGLTSILELAAAIDDMQTVLQTDFRTSTSRQHLELQAKTAGQRLRALKRDHAPLASNTILAACSIDTQYKQIHGNDIPDSSVMIRCACSVKEYFDDLLSRPPAFLHQMAIIDWILILYVAVLMFKLSRQAASATGWERGALTSMLQPEQTMERLLNHMASAPASDLLVPKHDGLLYWLHQFVQNSKNVLANDPAGAARQADVAEGRFRPMNSEAVPLSSRPLSYQSQEQSAKLQTLGVLDQDFWWQLANGG